VAKVPLLPSGTRLRLKIPTIGVALHEDGRKVVLVAPLGAIVELLDPLTEADELVLVRLTGRTCQMFSIDLRERGEVIDAAFK
jgi:hypothetical protein